MPGKNESEIVRILRDLIASVDSFSSVAPLFPSERMKLEADLFQARQLGMYRGLLYRLIREINSGIPLEDIRLNKSRLWREKINP